MKPRLRWDIDKKEWAPRVIWVAVHFDDERLSWASIKDIAKDAFGDCGYSVDDSELTVSSNGIDHVVTSTLYKISPN